ncbi:MAG: UvrABC system protein A [Parcubacteria group bacterium GW2011_GWA1_42_7]|nr:MAG: UvrABC system protein A [Parcubacteria group bacterium GW2011_GWA1_42_7]
METALKIGKGILEVSAIGKSASLRGASLRATKQSRDITEKPILNKSGGSNSGLLRRPQNGTPRNDKSKDFIFSELFACAKCGFSLSEIEPRLFSFNSPFGACPECQGLGSKLEIDPNLVMPNPRLTLAEGAIRPWANASHRVGRQGYYSWILSKLADQAGFSLNAPVGKLPKEVIIYGAKEYKFEGGINNLERRWKETDSEFARAEIEKYMLVRKCPLCRGGRLKQEALAIKLDNHNIVEVSAMSVGDLKNYFQNLKLSKNREEIARSIIKEILKRLQFLIDVGLEYLTLERNSTTLSGGEAQRIRLATQIGSGLSGVIYILDEPSIGLHPRDMGKLIATLKELRDLGNSVIVVEHDEQTMKEADWIIDIGPGAGTHGGKVIFEGTWDKLLKSDTLTGEYLSGRKKVAVRLFPSDEGKCPKGDGELKFSLNTSSPNLSSTKEGRNTDFLQILGATEHNLKNINVKIPLGCFAAVTGVSGSGKSTLVNDILGSTLARDFHGAHTEPGAHKLIKGTGNLDKVILIDQSPIGRTPRSNPATYTGLFTPIRAIFASTQEARVRGYNLGRFSFNVKGGRCEACEGEGLKKIEMFFLPDVYVECEECKGKRYNQEALQIEYKGKNISDVLEMSVEEAYEFFQTIPMLENKLKTLKEVGLNYMKIGQPSTTLSGGEAQRIKLATELARRDTGRTLYILDEPTTGLHFDDIKKLLNVLHQLVARGNSVLIIEHNMDVISSADWIIDLGPEGGQKGGYLVAEGTPAQIKKNKKSYTGRYLK